MNISKFCYLIMTEEEVNVIKDSLKLCMDAITSKMSSVGFNEGYNSKKYCELCSQYAKYVTLSTDIEIGMNHDDEKNDRIMPNLYCGTMTEEEVDTIIESFKTSMDIIEYKMYMAEFDASYIEQQLYISELGTEYVKYEGLLSKIESTVGSKEE